MSVTKVVSGKNILTLLFPEVVTENVSALREAISTNVASSIVEKSPFVAELYKCERVCSGFKRGTEAGK